MAEPTTLAVCVITGCNEVLSQVQFALVDWSKWAWISKAGAVLIGVIVAAGGVLIAGKQLPNRWHYGVSAFVAACVFTYGLLQPYEEYKQFRLAQYQLHGAYMRYLTSTHSGDDLRALITAFDEARTQLRENWKQPPVQ